LRVLFTVFSGTGNTLRVASGLAEELSSHQIEADVYRICSKNEVPYVQNYDVLVVGYPVHAFNAPTAALKFFRDLPQGNGKRVYILRTSGEPLVLNDASAITPKRILKKRGYDVVGEFSYVMPYNIIFRHSDKMAARMWNCAQNRIKRDAMQIVRGDGSNKRINLFKRAVSFVLRIEHTAMPLLGRNFKADSKKCKGCGLCVSVCPTSNITMIEGKPKFGRSCVGCMACSFGCPTDAIKISLLNGWRVNGQYSFAGEQAADSEVCKYCRRSYLKYFHESENID